MDKKSIYYLLAFLTFIDLIIVSVFILILLNQNQSKNMGLNGINDIGQIEVEDDYSVLNEEAELTEENSIIGTHTYEIKADWQGNIDDSILQIFRNKLEGQFIVSDTMSFEFCNDGTFNGFFDSNNASCMGGTYYLTMTEEEQPILTIYNSDETAMVSYNIALNEAGDGIELYYQPADIYILLK